MPDALNAFDPKPWADRLISGVCYQAAMFSLISNPSGAKTYAELEAVVRERASKIMTQHNHEGQ